MKFEFVIPPSDVEETRLMVRADKTGNGAFYLTLCFAQVTILSERESEPNLVLGHVPFLNLLSDLKFFIQKNSTEEYARGSINDMYQSYGIHLSKEKSKLILSARVSRKSQMLTVKCPLKPDEFANVADLFLEQYLRACPELAESKQWEYIKKEFNLKR